MSAMFNMRVRWGAWWYRLAFAGLSGQRRVMRANLRAAFPNANRPGLRRVEQQVLSAQGQFYGELSAIGPMCERIQPPPISGPGEAAF